MRPTDENQHGSTRPNLMSPSRLGGGDDNILAMLERDAGRGRSRQFSSHRRMAWYAGASTVVVAMVAALGWLAWENATKTRAIPIEMTQALPVSDADLAAAAPAPAAPAAATIDLDQHLPAAAATASVLAEQPVQAAAAVASTAAGQPTRVRAAASAQSGVAVLQTAGAAIIDTPAAPSEAPVLLAQAGVHATSAPAAQVLLAQAGAHATSAPQATPQVAQPSRLPPLVLLPRDEAAPKRKPAAPEASAARPKPAAALPPKAEAALASRPAAKADAASPSRSAIKADATAAPRAVARTDTARTARRAAKADAAPVSRAAAKAPPRSPARPTLARAKKANTAAAAEKSPDASADTDVALISAIIMHSSKHAAERAKAEAARDCDGGKCPARR